MPDVQVPKNIVKTRLVELTGKTIDNMFTSKALS